MSEYKGAWNSPNPPREASGVYQSQIVDTCQKRQAEALERIADTLDRMLAVMLDEPEEVDPEQTLDSYADESTPWTEGPSTL